jgi:hypothetical protein
MYSLSRHAYCCEVEGGAVILELATGRYVGIDTKYLHDLRSRVSNWPKRNDIDPGTECVPDAESEGIIARLHARGILTTRNTPGRSTLSLAATAALIPSESWMRGGPAVKCFFQFAMSLLIVSLRYRNKTLASMVNWLSENQRSIHLARRDATSYEVERLVASFSRLRIWFYTADRHCLFDSLVLAVFLTRLTVPCTFAIGVSTKPFLAHSWVQVGDLILNDTIEHVHLFTPILAAGESR